jgi:hypothetical protein
MTKYIATKIDRSPIEYTTIRAFGHEFKHVLPGLAEELITLEKEGVLYLDQFDGETGRINHYRLRFLPQEIVRYVEGSVAQQEYFEAMKVTKGDKEKALSLLTNKEIAEEVRRYPPVVINKEKGITEDIRGCHASFIGRELEALTCFGSHPERLELIPQVSSRDKVAIILDMFESVSTNIGYLQKRKHDRPPVKFENEYDLQDLLYIMIKPVFPDAITEEYTPKNAGSSKRIDIAITSIKTVVEAKFVRNKAHASSVGDEIKVDIESYHTHPACKTLCVLVYDPGKHIADPVNLKDDLTGLRVINGKQFETRVVVKN